MTMERRHSRTPSEVITTQPPMQAHRLSRIVDLPPAVAAVIREVILHLKAVISTFKIEFKINIK